MSSPVKPHLLLLVHRIPYPPNKGDKIRSYHLLRHLNRHYQVHLGCFIDDSHDLQYVETVKAFCGDTCFIALRPWLAKLQSLKALLLRRALTLDYYFDAGMRRWVDETVAKHQIRNLVVFSSSMGQYIEHLAATKKIIDFVDIDSDKWLQYAQSKWWPLSWLYRREGTSLLRYERQLAANAGHALFVSEAEAALFKRLAPESEAKIAALNNGVDADYFAPNAALLNPYPSSSGVITFTGAMDYWPNCEAVSWFAHEIFPLIRQRAPHAAFYIVGSRPTDSMLALGKLAGVHVSGSVPDIRPYLQHAQVVVAPLRTARGIQNKVLEAMAMAKTVVVSPAALEGLEASPDTELLLANTPAQFAEQICAVFNGQRSDLGPAARRQVLARYNWETNLSTIDALLSTTSLENTDESC